MAASVRLAEYFYITVPDKPGEGARALATLKDAVINLLAFSGVSRSAALANGLHPRRPNRVQAGGEEGQVEGYRSQSRVPRAGEDRVGAVADLLDRWGGEDDGHRCDQRLRWSLRRHSLGRGERRPEGAAGSLSSERGDC